MKIKWVYCPIFQYSSLKVSFKFNINLRAAYRTLLFFFSEHLQQLGKSTWYSYYFEKNSKTPIQQLDKSTWYISQLAKRSPCMRAYISNASTTLYRRFRPLPRTRVCLPCARLSHPRPQRARVSLPRPRDVHESLSHADYTS